MAAHGCQRLEPSGLMVLKAGSLIHDHHVERPLIPVQIPQPGNILPVDNINVCVDAQGAHPLLLGSQDRDNPKIRNVIPFLRFRRPRSFRHLFRRDDQDPDRVEPLILQDPDRGQGYDCLAKSHVQKQTDALQIDDPVDAVPLILMRLKLHPISPSYFFCSFSAIAP